MEIAMGRTFYLYPKTNKDTYQVFDIATERDRFSDAHKVLRHNVIAVHLATPVAKDIGYKDDYAYGNAVPDPVQVKLASLFMDDRLGVILQYPGVLGSPHIQATEQEMTASNYTTFCVEQADTYLKEHMTQEDYDFWMN